MRVPRPAAVALSAVALTGALAACGGDDADEPVVTDPTVQEPAVSDPDAVADPDVPVAPGEDVVPSPT